MYSNEHTLQDLLRKAYRQLDMTEVVTEMEVKEAYRKVVGDLIGKLTWEIRFKDGTLKVSIASPGLKQELWYRRESLMEKINKMLGRSVIKRIVLV